MNSSQNRLKNYSGLMDLINNSLSDIKNILNVETEKNEFKAKPERESEDKLIENLQINYRNPLNKRSHKTVKSCNENELEKIRFELGIPDVSRGRINSRNIDKIKVIDKLYMTTIDENEEKNNESHDHSDSSMIHENVIILQPKGERSYKFTPKNNNDKVSQFKNYITDCTEKTTVENDFLDRNISKDSNINIVLDTDQGYIIKKNQKNICRIKKLNNKFREEANSLEINLVNEKKHRHLPNFEILTNDKKYNIINENKINEEQRCIIG